MAYITDTDVAAPGSEWTWPSGISSAEKTSLIAAAQERINQVTNYRWDTSGSIGIIVSGDGSNLLEIRKVITWPIASVTKVEFRNEYDSTDNFTASGEEIDADEYAISDSKMALVRIAPTTIRGGLDALGAIWISGYRNYKITGTFGVANTPYGIKRAAVMLVREAARPGSTARYTNVVSETFPDGYKYTTAEAVKSAIGTIVPTLTGVRAADIYLKDFVRGVPFMAVP